MSDNSSNEEYDVAFLGKCKEVKMERKGGIPGFGPDQQDSTHLYVSLLELDQELALLGHND